MSKDYSEAAMLRFLDYLSNKHLMKPATVRARKASAKKMLDVLDPADKQDLRSIDIDQLHEQFVNKHGMDFTPASRSVYKSRFKAAHGDFIRYTDNPSGFKPSVGKRVVGRRLLTKARKSKKKLDKVESVLQPAQVSSPGRIVFPVPIRPELIVELHNIPSDMTAQEADKISAVVQALAQK